MLKRIILIVFLCIASLTVIAMISLFVASGAFLTPHYLDPWQKQYAQTFTDPRIQLAAHGLLAASGHNMQPWRIKLDTNKNVLYLFADSKRLTPEVDPLARQTMVSQGTFLEYFSVAADKIGYKTDIVLFPNGTYDEKNLVSSMDTQPVAKITLSKVDRKTNVLYDSMFLADSNRAAYQPTQLTAGELQQLLTININPNLTLKFYQDEQNLKKLGDYAIAGTKIEAGIHRMNVESANIFRANEWQKNEYRYGFSVEGQGTTGVMKYFLEGLITLVPLFNNENTSASRDITITETAVTNTPAYAMIISKNNSRIEQVESGMLYSKLILTAHSLGFVMQPPSQVLEEYPEMKEKYNSIHSNYAPTGGTIQMFIRIGKPTQTYPPTMRKDVMNLVE